MIRSLLSRLPYFARSHQRLACRTCGGWVEFPRGQLNLANQGWHEAGSPEAIERDRLAPQFSAFMRRHHAHRPNDLSREWVRLLNADQFAYWRLDPARRESLG